MKKIWHFSDTHTYHDLLEIPKNITIVICSGDISNAKHKETSYKEIMNFIEWFKKLPIKYKVFVAGNHDSAIETNTLDIIKEFEKAGIYYIQDSFIEIEGIKIYGTPYTPTFGEWFFMKARHKMNDLWNKVPDDTDILVTHGPPKGLLDLSYNKEGVLEFCGCKSLRNHCISRLNLKLCLFGHIHNTEDIINAGITKLSVCDTIFSNGSVVTDGKFGRLSSNGNILEYI